MRSVELLDIAATSLTEVIWRAPGGDALGTVTEYNAQDMTACFVPNDAQWGLQRWVKWTELDTPVGLAEIIRGRTGNRCETPECTRNFDVILTMDTGTASLQTYRCHKHGEGMREQATSYTVVTWSHHINISPRVGWRKVSTGLDATDVDNIRDLYRKNTDGKEGRMFKFVPEFE